MVMDSDSEFIAPPSKRRARSNSQDDDPSYRGNRASSPRQEGEPDYFKADKLFEYQWPLEEPDAEHYMLQEQVKEFLDIRGIQRKYPDWRRRTLEFEERKYLVGLGVVSETLSNMGLVALYSEEVLEAMATDYPGKYRELMAVLKERQLQEIVEARIHEARKIAAIESTLENNEDAMMELRSQALSSVSQFNRQLSAQKQTLTLNYTDHNTNIKLTPRAVQKVCSPPANRSRYPVALVPGQFSDYCPAYTSQELNSLPLNTVTGVPDYLKSIMDKPLPDPPAVMESPLQADTPTNTAHTPLPKPTPPTHATPPQNVILEATSNFLRAINTMHSADKSADKSPSIMSSLQKLLTSYAVGMDAKSTKSETSSKISSNASSRRSSPADFLKESTSSKGSSSLEVSSKTTVKSSETDEKKIEEAPSGSSSNTASEAKPVPSKAPSDAIPVRSETPSDVTNEFVSSGPLCSQCEKSMDSDNTVSCRGCDKVYHSACVALDGVPVTDWRCPACVRCGTCQTMKPGPSEASQWMNEFIDGRFIHTLCEECSGFFRKGFYCPVCYKVYKNDETDSPMVCCDSCDRWIHIECDGISPEQYERLSEDKSDYSCRFCRNNDNPANE